MMDVGCDRAALAEGVGKEELGPGVPPPGRVVELPAGPVGLSLPLPGVGLAAASVGGLVGAAWLRADVDQPLDLAGSLEDVTTWTTWLPDAVMA